MVSSWPAKAPLRLDLWSPPVSQLDSAVVTYSRAADGEWRFRAITPDGPFEEQDVEFSTPESLLASGDVEVVRDSGALMEGRVERRRLEIRRTRRRFGQRPG